MKCILTTFDTCYMETQYMVNNYRVDLYFLEYDLAIECDENQHNCIKNKDADEIRQNYISQKNGCSFIRFILIN